MRLIFTRLSERNYETHIIRDGVRYHVKGVGHILPVPHDLVHLAIEEALGLRNGFWGSVDQGAVFGSMTHVAGRRKPHATQRSKDVLKANRHDISEAEILVSTIKNALEQNSSDPEHSVRTALRRCNWVTQGRKQRRHFKVEDVSRVCAMWERIRQLWSALPVGESLEFEWPIPRGSPGLG